MALLPSSGDKVLLVSSSSYNSQHMVVTLHNQHLQKLQNILHTITHHQVIRTRPHIDRLTSYNNLTTIFTQCIKTFLRDQWSTLITIHLLEHLVKLTFTFFMFSLSLIPNKNTLIKFTLHLQSNVTSSRLGCLLMH